MTQHAIYAKVLVENLMKNQERPHFRRFYTSKIQDRMLDSETRVGVLGPLDPQKFDGGIIFDAEKSLH